MVLSSYEVRWFLPGPVPDEVVDRFWSAGAWRSAGAPARSGWPERAREDHYLVFTADLGVKSRNEPGAPSKLEFKGLLTDHGPVELVPGVVGRAEHWVKWSYEGTAGPDALLAAVAGASQSVAVEKRRMVRKVRLDVFGNDEEVAPGIPADRALQLELTRVRLPGRDVLPHWTLSLEAFPVDANIAGDVRRTAGPFLSELSGPSGLPDPSELPGPSDVSGPGAGGGSILRAGTSLSYPAWLLDVTVPP